MTSQGEMMLRRQKLKTGRVEAEWLVVAAADITAAEFVVVAGEVDAAAA